ncbi:hypothetical protein K488DRAFT_42677 [Vararia minispora EC-137]|uniref:Uncharacterized protein n=1 Tax=Vararia minispora EC-137 TaxID=1314806 RepID=A0ACB8QVA4_9AGAM|nr:hypothetical protein K488DRAFT_42677 [Vararia minispora EC-137]
MTLTAPTANRPKAWKRAPVRYADRDCHNQGILTCTRQIDLGAAPTNITVSSTFHFGFYDKGNPSDVMLVSADCVYFCVCSERLLSVSNDGFGSLLPASHNAILSVPLTSKVLNVLLHAIYDLPLARYAPSINDISQAIAAMGAYGIKAKHVITPPSSLFQTIIQNAISSPLECYAIAASSHLEELAVAVSPYTLSCSFVSLKDSMVRDMGPQYLKRLVCLHYDRVNTFKQLVFPPPGPHPPTDTCDIPAQRALARAWTLAMAYLCWDFQVALSVSTIEAALRPLGKKLECEVCGEYLDRRIKKLLVEWSLVKVCTLPWHVKKVI